MLPSGITRWGIRGVRLLPESVLRLLLPPRLDFDGADAHRLEFPSAPVRLFIGPVNFASQGYAWARAAERLPGVRAVSMAYHAAGDYGFAVDQPVPASVYLLSHRWSREQSAKILAGSTHVIIEAGRHLFGDVYGRTVLQEIDQMRAAGIRVALLGHGSDARSGPRHRTEYPDSPYHSETWTDRDALERESEAHRALMRASSAPVFVSTPGMIDDVPDARWLPVVVDIARWETDRVVMADEVPLVVHAPSSPIVKGSDLIEPALRELADSGLIRYERLSKVPAAQMPQKIAQADIVLDQFRLGDYGVAACEAMAAGAVVVGNITGSVRERVRAVTGLELPIVQSRPHEIGSVLRELMANRRSAQAVAARGRAFVETTHDGTASAQVLRAFLES